MWPRCHKAMNLDVTAYASKSVLLDVTAYASKTVLHDVGAYASKTVLLDVTAYASKTVLHKCHMFMGAYEVSEPVRIISRLPGLQFCNQRVGRLSM